MRLVTLCILLSLSSCAIRYHRESTGLVLDEQLSEISGIVPSAYHSGLFWVHNDGGNSPILYLIDTLGTIHARLFLDHAKNRDWEDLTQGQENGVSFLYIGDIGDNKKLRESVQIYKVKEPTEKQGDLTAMPEVMNIRYADGARDAEALMHDPQTDELILVTKRELNVHVYAFPFKQGDQQIARKGTLHHTWITGGDINEAGEILLKNYGHVFYWPQNSEQSAVDRLLEQRGKAISYRREPLGEAICWIPSGGFITISEQFRQKTVKIYRYKAHQDTTESFRE